MRTVGEHNHDVRDAVAAVRRKLALAQFDPFLDIGDADDLRHRYDSGLHSGEVPGEGDLDDPLTFAGELDDADMALVWADVQAADDVSRECFHQRKLRPVDALRPIEHEHEVDCRVAAAFSVSAGRRARQRCRREDHRTCGCRDQAGAEFFSPERHEPYPSLCRGNHCRAVRFPRTCTVAALRGRDYRGKP